MGNDRHNKGKMISPPGLTKNCDIEEKCILAPAILRGRELPDVTLAQGHYDQVVHQNDTALNMALFAPPAILAAVVLGSFVKNKLTASSGKKSFAEELELERQDSEHLKQL